MAPKTWSWTDIPYLMTVASGREHEGSPTKVKAEEILTDLFPECADEQLDWIADMQAFLHCRATGKNYSRLDKSHFAFLKYEREIHRMRREAAQEQPSHQAPPQQIRTLVETAA